MHLHEHEHEHEQDNDSGRGTHHPRAELRPKSARLDSSLSASRMMAGATGQFDVLDAQSILGLQRAVGNVGVGAMLEAEGR